MIWAVFAWALRWFDHNPARRQSPARCAARLGAHVQPTLSGHQGSGARHQCAFL